MRVRELISFALSSNTLLVTREPDGIGVCVYRIMSASEKSLSRLLLKMAFRNAGMVLGPLHQLSGRTVCFGKLVGGLEFCDCELRVLNLVIIGCVLVLILFLVLVLFRCCRWFWFTPAGRESTRLRRAFDTSGLLMRVASARMSVSKALSAALCVGAAWRITEC